MRLTMDALMDRFSSCIYDLLLYSSDFIKEGETKKILLQSELNKKKVRIPILMKKTNNDHYNVIILSSSIIRQSIEIICNPKKYCYSEIGEWVKSVISTSLILDDYPQPLILEEFDGHFCLCEIAGIVHITNLNNKNYLGNEWLKDDYMFRGFSLDPNKHKQICFKCMKCFGEEICSPIIPLKNQ